MLPGPIFAVELLTTARRARYFLLRALYASILLVAFGIVYTESTRFSSGMDDIGRIANFTAAFFQTFSVLQLLAVVVMGPAMAAGTIASERERRTIEYLFTTTLTDTEIIVGKLAARCLHIGYLVLAGVPVLAIAMLLGGISPDALCILLLMTLSTLVTVAMISTAISVFSARASQAVIKAYLVLFVLLVLPPLAYGLQMGFGVTWFAPVNDQLLAANPFRAFVEINSAGSGPGAWAILGAMARNQLIAGAAVLVLASFMMRRVYRRQQETATRRRRWRFQLFRGAVGNSPMLWKEIHAEPAASRLGWVGLVAIGLLLGAVIALTYFTASETLTSTYSRSAENYLGYAAGMGTFIECLGLLLLGARAAGSVTSEKERQCWDSLLATPLEGRPIVNAKVLGSIWALRGLALPLAIVWVPALVFAPQFLLALFFNLATFLVLAMAVASLGVKISLWAKNSVRAMGLTVGIGVFVGGGYLFCCTPLMWAGPGDGIEIILAPCIPFLLAFPGMIAAKGFPTHEPAIVFAYIFGNIGYLVVAAVLYNMAVGGFDRMVGRTVPGDRMRRDGPGAGGMPQSTVN